MGGALVKSASDRDNPTQVNYFNGLRAGISGAAAAEAALFEALAAAEAFRAGLDMAMLWAITSARPRPPALEIESDRVSTIMEP